MNSILLIFIVDVGLTDDWFKRSVDGFSITEAASWGFILYITSPPVSYALLLTLARVTLSCTTITFFLCTAPTATLLSRYFCPMSCCMWFGHALALVLAHHLCKLFGRLDCSLFIFKCFLCAIPLSKKTQRVKGAVDISVYCWGEYMVNTCIIFGLGWIMLVNNLPHYFAIFMFHVGWTRSKVWLIND